MVRRHHTVILVPHARAKLRKWRISDLQLRVAAAAIVVVTLTSGFITWAYFTESVDRAQIERLREENQDLRQVNESFETSIRDLQGMLADYEERTLQLAIIAGLGTTSDGTEAGIGGDPFQPVGTDRYDLEVLESRLGSMSGTLDQVEDRLEERIRLISATPAIAPARGILTSGFGIRRDPITGGRAFHQGLDISAAPGQPVRAAADGLVVRAGRIGGLGRAVYLSHGFGLTTRYGHLSKLAVAAGAEVKRGDVIGYVGNTGRSTGYHLHYEVHQDGRAVDPLPFILDRPAG